MASWLALLGGSGQGGEPEPALDNLRGHVEVLASRTFQGRRGPGAEKAAEYLVAQFKRLGLEPLFGDSFVQVIPGKTGEAPLGRNVGAKLPGADPARVDEWVIVSAHFDHLGTRGNVIYPGADDNASGVAMMLEVARSFTEAREKPRRGVMFVGFDLEEAGLFGSRYFAEHPPVPLPKVALFVTADMIGRALCGVCSAHVFVMGTEHAPWVRPVLARASEPEAVTVGVVGTDLLLIARSDYGPFRARGVPYLFFSTGENPVYHTAQDVPETLDYPKLEAVSRIIFRVVDRVARSDKTPSWSPRPVHDPGEARTLRDVLSALLKHREELKIGPAQSALMTRLTGRLDAISARGGMTEDERSYVMNSVRLVMLSLF